MRSIRFAVVLLANSGLLFILLSQSEGEPAPTGPQTEKRFPPLQLPAGFKATLFACDPLIEYPSVIALGPRPRSLFVAVDYMTGLGTEIVRRDEVRLIEDTDGDGYADKSTVFAEGFNSIQGLAWHDGTLYVMHAPYLSVVRDTKGTGKADERRDLFVGLGLAPEKDQIRLHNANGVVVGHDGWLYLALGDHGCDVKRPEGDRLVLNNGGILRCRPDGRDLHVFATGLRNIYDVALDAELNVFVRDNENDGGEYKIRVCHSFSGADHGYPYLYYEHPHEALPPLADLGLGSSAGGVCYLERQFPAEYHGNLFFCEWGRSVVRYAPRRQGATFAPLKELEFAAGAANDPYGFKPTDLVVDRDGSLFISDWADGQRPRRGRGRIYLVRYAGNAPEKRAAPDNRLDSDSYHERREAQEALERQGKQGVAAIMEAIAGRRLGSLGRMHAVWVLAKVEGPAAVEKLFALAKDDPEPRVQAQAVRALADLTDPVLVRHRLDAPRADAALAERFAALAAGRDAQVQLEIVVALGRLGWSGAPEWLRQNLKQPDAALAHAAQQALRRSGNWPAVLKLLDEPDSEPFRAIARRAVAGQYEPVIVDGLVERLRRDLPASRRQEYAELLTRVHKKPASPWTYWGFRPPPRPANSTRWERTDATETALAHLLADPDRAVRLAVLRGMLREKVPAPTAALGRWLQEEREAETVATLLAGLRDQPAGEVRPHLESVLRDREQTAANRLLAASLFAEGLDAQSEPRLPQVAEKVEDGPVLAELLRAIGRRKLQAAMPLLLRKLTSENTAVRACAVGAFAELNARESDEPVRKLLDDPQPRVRSAAARAAGRLSLRTAAERLLALARDPDADVRRASLEALRLLGERRAEPIAVAALADPDTAIEALAYLGKLGGPEHAGAVTELARRQPSVETLAAVGKVLTGWAVQEGITAAKRQDLEKALAEVHGGSGVLVAWHVRGPLPPGEVSALPALPTGPDPAPGWRLVLSAGLDSRLTMGPVVKVSDCWFAYTEITVREAARVELLTASPGLETIWLNDKNVFQRQKPGVIGPYPDRFEANLEKGLNRVLVRLTGAKEKAEFQLRLRRKSATADQERLALAALSRAGNPERGKQVFLNAEKSLCIKCHRVGEQGERFGPELTGLGSRFSKIYIVESILEPSRSIAPSFETWLITLKSGKVLSGIKVAETETQFTLVDNQAAKHLLAKTDVESQQKQPTSTMPDGLEKRLSEDEFVDLVSFLANLKEARGR
jgi:putative membrane-bound dehydrogenase-like protein